MAIKKELRILGTLFLAVGLLAFVTVTPTLTGAVIGGGFEFNSTFALSLIGIIFGVLIIMLSRNIE